MSSSVSALLCKARIGEQLGVLQQSVERWVWSAVIVQRASMEIFEFPTCIRLVASTISNHSDG